MKNMSLFSSKKRTKFILLLLSIFLIFFVGGMILQQWVDMFKLVVVLVTALFFYFLSGYLIVRKFRVKIEDVLVLSVLVSILLLAVSVLINSFILRMESGLIVWVVIILFIDFVVLFFLKKFGSVGMVKNKQLNFLPLGFRFKFSKKFLFSIILIALFLFHVVNNFVIIFNDQAGILGDDIIPYDDQIKFFHGSEQDLLSRSLFIVVYQVIGYPFYPILGLNKYTFWFINSLFLFILIFSVYRIGSIIHSRKVGLLSSFIVTFFPATFSFSRVSFYEFNLMSSLFLTLYLLLKTNKFNSRVYSLFFGLSFVFLAGMKSSFILYVIWPIALYLIYSFKDSEVRKKRFKNSLLSFSIFVILTAIFYYPNLIRTINQGITDSTYIFFSTDRWFFVYSFWSFLLFPFFSIIFILSFFYLFLKKNKIVFTFLLCVLPPLIILSFVFKNNLAPRFSLSLVPYFAFIISLGVFSINNKLTRLFVVSSLIVLSLFQFFMICYFPCNSYSELFESELFNSRCMRPYDFSILHDRYDHGFFSSNENGFFSPSGYDFEFNKVRDIINPYMLQDEHIIIYSEEMLEHYIRSFFIFGNISHNFNVVKNKEDIGAAHFIFSERGDNSGIFKNYRLQNNISNSDDVFKLIGSFQLERYGLKTVYQIHKIE